MITQANTQFIEISILSLSLDIESLTEYFILVSNLVSDYYYVLFSIIVITSSGLTILLAGKADKILKRVGQVGTGVLATVGATDSVLNLHDRWKDYKDNKSSGSGDDSNDKDKNKEDKNKDKSDNKVDSNSNTDKK